jgi:uncharacterized protein YfeS
MTDDGLGLPPAAPEFERHFSHPLYDDQGNDLAPFGSDEGNDLLMDWDDRRAELDRSSTLATILECGPDEVATTAGPMQGVDGLQTAGFISSAAFVLLRLVGTLDDSDRELALAALDFQIDILPVVAPGNDAAVELLRVQRDDLAAWRNPV